MRRIPRWIGIGLELAVFLAGTTGCGKHRAENARGAIQQDIGIDLPKDLSVVRKTVFDGHLFTYTFRVESMDGVKNLIETLNLEELRKAREDRNFKADYTHISDIDEGDVDLFYVKSGEADVLWDGRADVIYWEMRFNKVSRHLIIWLSYPDY